MAMQLIVPVPDKCFIHSSHTENMRLFEFRDWFSVKDRLEIEPDFLVFFGRSAVITSFAYELDAELPT